MHPGLQSGSLDKHHGSDTDQNQFKIQKSFGGEGGNELVLYPLVYLKVWLHPVM